MHKEIITNMDVNSSETQILTSGDSIKIYSIGEKNLSLDSEIPNESESSKITYSLFLGNSGLIALSTSNGSLIIYKQEHPNFVKIHEKQLVEKSISSFTFQEKENYVYSIIFGCSDGTVYSCILNKENGIHSYQELNHIDHKYGIVSLSSNKNYILSGGEDNTIKLSNETDVIFKCKYNSEVKDVVILREDCFEMICFSVCLENEVRIYNKRKNDEDFNCQVIDNLNLPTSVKYTKAGYCLVVGCEDGYKSFAPNEEGKFVEVEMEKVE